MKKENAGFHYRKQALFVDGIPLQRLAEQFETPLYVYSARQLRMNYVAIDQSFEGIPHLICYALKANSNLAVLRALSMMGSGADIVSGGELYRAALAGIPANRIVFAGVGKQIGEIRDALRHQILMFNVESSSELQHISGLARELKLRAPVSLRVNPDVDARTHPYITTGLRRHKFGVDLSTARALYRKAARMKYLEVRGIHMHLGSQISSAAPFVRALKRVLAFVDDLMREGIAIRYLDMGGGMGIQYKTKDEELHPAALAGAVRSLLRGRDLTLILEPGRAITGNAGVLLTRVLDCKGEFVVVDAGMNDLIRPSLYGAYHEIRPVARTRRRAILADVVGPVCETGDFLARRRRFPQSQPGDLLAVMGAGAYGWSMSSNYNSRPRAAEVLVDGTRVLLAGRRETHHDLVQREML